MPVRGPCPMCGGCGVVKVTLNSAPEITDDQDCPECDGTGMADGHLTVVPLTEPPVKGDAK